MKTTQTLRSLVLAQALALAAAFGAQAAPEDYTFTLTSSDLRPGDGVDIAVSLTDLRTNTPVSGAVIFTTRLDMAPDGMEAMHAEVSVPRYRRVFTLSKELDAGKLQAELEKLKQLLAAEGGVAGGAQGNSQPVAGGSQADGVVGCPMLLPGEHCGPVW